MKLAARLNVLTLGGVIQVWAGGEASVQEVVTRGNGVCGFRSHGLGSVLRLLNCSSSDTVAHQEVDRGKIEVLETNVTRDLKHS